MGKNLLSSNTSSRCSHNMVNFGPLAALRSIPVVWGTPANVNGFRLRVLAALLHGRRTRYSSSGCQPNFAALKRAPPIFGRAAITLGIGPHSSSLVLFWFCRRGQYKHLDTTYVTLQNTSYLVLILVWIQFRYSRCVISCFV